MPDATTQPPATVKTQSGSTMIQLPSGEVTLPHTQRDYPAMIMIGGRDWHHVRTLPDGRWVYRYDR